MFWLLLGQPELSFFQRHRDALSPTELRTSDGVTLEEVLKQECISHNILASEGRCSRIVTSKCQDCFKLLECVVSGENVGRFLRIRRALKVPPGMTRPY